MCSNRLGASAFEKPQCICIIKLNPEIKYSGGPIEALCEGASTMFPINGLPRLCTIIFYCEEEIARQNIAGNVEQICQHKKSN